MVIFCVGGLVALIGSIGIMQSWNWMVGFKLTFPLVLHLFLDVFIFISWFSVVVILWKGYRWGILWSTLVTVITTAWYWVDRILLTNNPLQFSRHLVALFVTLVLLILIFSSLALVKPYINQTHDQDKVDHTRST